MRRLPARPRSARSRKPRRMRSLRHCKSPPSRYTRFEALHKQINTGTNPLVSRCRLRRSGYAPAVRNRDPGPVDPNAAILAEAAKQREKEERRIEKEERRKERAAKREEREKLKSTEGGSSSRHHRHRERGSPPRLSAGQVMVSDQLFLLLCCLSTRFRRAYSPPFHDSATCCDSLSRLLSPCLPCRPVFAASWCSLCCGANQRSKSRLADFYPSTHSLIRVKGARGKIVTGGTGTGNQTGAGGRMREGVREGTSMRHRMRGSGTVCHRGASTGVSPGVSGVVRTGEGITGGKTTEGGMTGAVVGGKGVARRGGSLSSQCAEPPRRCHSEMWLHPSLLRRTKLPHRLCSIVRLSGACRLATCQ